MKSGSDMSASSLRYRMYRPVPYHGNHSCARCSSVFRPTGDRRQRALGHPSHPFARPLKEWSPERSIWCEEDNPEWGIGWEKNGTSVRYGLATVFETLLVRGFPRSSRTNCSRVTVHAWVGAWATTVIRHTCTGQIWLVARVIHWVSSLGRSLGSSLVGASSPCQLPDLLST